MIPALRPALITTPRLVLEPLGVQHAAEMADVLAGTAFTGTSAARRRQRRNWHDGTPPKPLADHRTGGRSG